MYSICKVTSAILVQDFVHFCGAWRKCAILHLFLKKRLSLHCLAHIIATTLISIETMF